MDRDGSLNFVGGNRGTSNGEPSAVAKKMDRDSSQKLAGGNRGTSNGEPSVFRGNQSFAAVVNEARANTSVGYVGDPEMSWKIQNEVEEWLTRSAVGFLRDFSDVNSVNLKLEARGFTFTSTYLGGKCVVWTFESELDRDGFIRNRFFWSDSFISMSLWNESFVALGSLRWLEVYGVPLHCWCKEFFTKVGGQIGETVLVEDSTVRRERLDRGRILVLAPVGFQKDKMVVVKVGDKSFPVKIVASPELVSVDWITLYLRLKPVHNRRNSVVERSFFAGPMVVGSPVSEKRGQLDREEVPIERDLWVPEKTIRESIFAHPPSSGKVANKQVGNGLSGLLVGPLGNTSHDKAVMKKHGSNYKGNQDKQDEGILKAQPVDNALSDGVDPNNLVRSDEDPDNKVSEVGNQTVNNFQGVSSETESEKGIESRGINLYVDLSGQGGEILMATSDAQSQGGLDSGRMADDDSNQNRNTRCVERETTLEISKVKSIATGRKS
ncbi:hypothetical protein LWI29_005471 [Acer saccharum]|uniref:DUF4283 domain-containing protein n=1 Tax=Acer saccharum TaxID=4024 RepID=A0AA39W216_ACESA|nr:hypothetical protein LWI29_005471 [Acer saccharum]